MIHPFAALQPSYVDLLAHMVVTREREARLTAERLVGDVRAGCYGDVPTRTGIPVAWIAASFEREASSNFHLSPAQGDPWNAVSRHVPKGLGPYADWPQAARAAYHIDRLDAVGPGNWTGARCCYAGESFNGFGYRAHGVHTPYNFAGTNVYTAGKFVADGRFDPRYIDRQLGIIPMMILMAELDPAFAVPGLPALHATPVVPQVPSPPLAPDGVGGGARDAEWVQESLNALHIPEIPLLVDGHYGRITRAAVTAFQTKAMIHVDGLAGPETIKAIEAALKAAVPGGVTAL